MVTLCKLVAKEKDYTGYIVYVFENLEEDVIKETRYIMCVRYPNWDHRDIELGEVGYLNFIEVRAGVDQWFDGEKMIYYNYDNIQFIKFVSKPEKEDVKYEMLIKYGLTNEKCDYMTVLGDQLKKAIEAKNNDIKTFVWKLAKESDGSQKEIKLIDATPEQLNSFYQHCQSMLYSKDKLNPGRYELLNIIADQRKKCNIELFLRKLELGTICADKRPYPRYLYIQDLRAYINAHREDFPSDKLKTISIATCTGGLPREFERLSVNDVLDGGLDMLGWLDTKHITFSFILNMGVYLTPAEMKEFNEKDKNGNPRSKLEVIKERLGIKSTVRLNVKPSGLNFKELRAMVTLRPKKYSELTTDQLTILRDKVLFKLENEVMMHINQWEERKRQIKLVAASKGITLEE